MNPATLIQFKPDTPWEHRSQDNATSTWQHPCGDIASFHFFNIQPDIVTAPDSRGMPRIRQIYRETLGEHGGIVSVEPVTISSIKSIETIFKLQQKPTGMTYIASLTIPLRDFSFVVKFQCPEVGITGIRDAAIFLKLKPGLKFGANGVPRGWFKDPYAAIYDSQARYNLSDAAQYDVDFPDHPLSRARRHLGSLKTSLHVETALADLPQFGESSKPRWKFW